MTSCLKLVWVYHIPTGWIFNCPPVQSTEIEISQLSHPANRRLSLIYDNIWKMSLTSITVWLKANYPFGTENVLGVSEIPAVNSYWWCWCCWQPSWLLFHGSRVKWVHSGKRFPIGRGAVGGEVVKKRREEWRFIRFQSRQCILRENQPGLEEERSKR